MEVSRELLRQALLRVSALFSDKYRGVGLQFSQNLLKIVAVTTDKDEVEDEIEMLIKGRRLEIGFNASYVLEYLNIVKSERLRMTFSNPDHVVLFETVTDAHFANRAAFLCCDAYAVIRPHALNAFAYSSSA